MAELIQFGKKLALLVGINEYADTGIRQLNFSVQDIQDFSDILTDARRGGYEKINVQVLTDAETEKPRRNEILSKLTAISSTAGSALRFHARS